jgi:hypothetical protein
LLNGDQGIALRNPWTIGVKLRLELGNICISRYKRTPRKRTVSKISPDVYISPARSVLYLAEASLQIKGVTFPLTGARIIIVIAGVRVQLPSQEI